MTNDELQMMKEIRSSKVERRAGARSAVSSFGFRWSFGFRDSHREGAAGILPAVLFSGRSAGKMPAALWGSWRAHFRFSECMGTMNRANGAPNSCSARCRRGGCRTPCRTGVRRSGSWKAPTSLMPCIGTMNLERVRHCRQQGAADVPSAELRSDSSAGKMPAAPWGSWKASWFLALLTLFAVSQFTSTVLASTFTASLDRSTISVNESATLLLKFEGGPPADVPAAPDVPGLSIASIGQSSQFNFINGQSTSILSYNFLVRAAQPGDYTIPALSAMVDGKTLTSQPLKLKVLKSGQPTPDSEVIGKNAFLKLVAAKNEVYLGEVLPLEIRLYARQGNLRQPPQLGQDGFTVGKMIQQPVTKTPINNQYYSLLIYKTFVIPAKTGRLLLGPATMLLAVPHPNARVSVFGEIIDWMDATLTADALTIEVRPLPTNNVPADFNGAVGSYSLNLALSTNAVTVGDPITLTVQIGGHGPIESLTLSSLDRWRDFKVYPPITKVETTDPFGLDGTKTFEQAIIPENADMKELPP